MIVESIFTSAAKTLTGSGYGVVAQSENVPDRLASFLGELNYYDYALSGQEGSSPESPVVYSHLIFPDRPVQWHVLSRVGPGGYDYTRRAVFLAHHVAVTADELGDASTAGLLHDGSIFGDGWDGQVGLLPRRSLPRPRRQSVGQDAWHALAGHGDWAQFWVGRWRRSEKASFVVVPGDADVLALFSEALALLPAANANRVRFTTQMKNDSHKGFQLDWIGLTAGSPLADSILRRYPDQTLDLHCPRAGTPEMFAPEPEPQPEPEAEPVYKPLPREAGRARSRSEPVDVDDIPWQEDVLASYRKQMARPEPEPVPAPTPPRDPRAQRNPGGKKSARPKPKPSAPPPPPPPDTFLSRNAQPLMFGGGAALLTLVVGLAWWLLFGTKPPTADKSHDSTEKQRPHLASRETPKSGVPTPVAGLENPPAPIAPPVSLPPAPRLDRTLQQETTQAAEQTPAKLSESDGLLRVKDWLPELLKENQEVPLLTIDAEKVPPEPRFELLSGLNLGLTVKAPFREKEVVNKPEDGIEVQFQKGNEMEIVALRLDSASHRLLGYRKSPSGDEIIKRLQFSVLFIGSEDPSAQKAPPLWIAFTPLQQPIPISDGQSFKPWPTEPDPGRSDAFFSAAYEFSGLLQVQLKIDRLSLSILLGENPGWVFRRQKASLGDPPTDHPMDVPGRNGTWKTHLMVGHTFDRATKNQKEKTAVPALVASLTKLEWSGTDGPSAEEECDKDKGPGSTPSIKEEEGKETGAKPEEKATPKKATTAAKKKKDPLPSAPEPPKPPVADEPNAKRFPDGIGDCLLLPELFRRYGRVHGAILIPVYKDGKDDKKRGDLEVLRFGDPPPKRYPDHP